jgi:uncharacterized protein
MIAKGLITKRANDDQMPAQTVERDYILAQVCADIGAAADSRLVFKGGTLLRLCYFEDFRYSADLDFSAIDGLSGAGATAAIERAIVVCRNRVELPHLELVDGDSGGTAWIEYVGPLGAKPRKIKLDVSDDELVETHSRLPLLRRWPDLPEQAAIEGYALDEVAAEKLRCMSERVQCRDFCDTNDLLCGGDLDALEIWHLYLRKAANDVVRGKQRTPPARWAQTFERRLDTYSERWDGELGEYLADVPRFDDVRRQTLRELAPVIDAARSLSDGASNSSTTTSTSSNGSCNRR